MTYREIAYLVLDELKLASDDAIINENHVLALMRTMRAFLLKQKYLNTTKEVADSDYMTICVDLEVADTMDGVPCAGGKYLRSKDPVPDTLGIGNVTVSLPDYYQGNITIVTRDRMRYVGHNKYLWNIIYVSQGPDNRLYFKSANPQHMYLKMVQVRGVFEDPEGAAAYSCDTSSDVPCDIMDKEYPMELAYIPLLVEMTKKELLATLYKPADEINDARDHLANNTNADYITNGRNYTTPTVPATKANTATATATDTDTDA